MKAGRESPSETSKQRRTRTPKRIEVLPLPQNAVGYYHYPKTLWGTPESGPRKPLMPDYLLLNLSKRILRCE